MNPLYQQFGAPQTPAQGSGLMSFLSQAKPIRSSEFDRHSGGDPERSERDS